MPRHGAAGQRSDRGPRNVESADALSTILPSAPAGRGAGLLKCHAEVAQLVQVRVQFRPRRKPDATVLLPDGATAEALLRKVGEGVDSTLVVRGNTPISESEPLVDGEEILLLSAFSGG